MPTIAELPTSLYQILAAPLGRYGRSFRVEVFPLQSSREGDILRVNFKSHHSLDVDSTRNHGKKQVVEIGVFKRRVCRYAWRWDDEELAAPGSQVTFAEGVELFNAGEYYQCHDVLENLWNDAPEPQRGVLHGILQCSVGLYHLLHQNHRGAMVELGEGLTKLRKVGFQGGPLHAFEREASAVLEFIYSTQLEHAACADDLCITMDGSEQSYRLLGNFGAGQHLYRLKSKDGETRIQFFPQRPESSLDMGFLVPTPVTVKVPTLEASEEDLYEIA